MTDEERKAWGNTVWWAESIQTASPPVKGQTKDIADAILAADASLTALTKERDAWKEYAQHQEHCAACGEAVSDCAEGSELCRRAGGG